MPWPTRKPPVQLSPSRPRASSFSSSTVTSHPDPSSWTATDDPTLPQPITIAFTSAQRTPRECYVAASSASSTDCGNAMISTSHGALRRT